MPYRTPASPGAAPPGGHGPVHRWLREHGCGSQLTPALSPPTQNCSPAGATKGEDTAGPRRGRWSWLLLPGPTQPKSGVALPAHGGHPSQFLSTRPDLAGTGGEVGQKLGKGKRPDFARERRDSTKPGHGVCFHKTLGNWRMTRAVKDKTTGPWAAWLRG